MKKQTSTNRCEKKMDFWTRPGRSHSPVRLPKINKTNADKLQKDNIQEDNLKEDYLKEDYLHVPQAMCRVNSWNM